jgi:hypothetical protein
MGKLGNVLLRVVASFAFASGFWIGAAAQASADAVVNGVHRSTGPQGFDETTTFSCRGMPTCSGTYTSTVRHANCSNYNTFGGEFVATGLNLTQSGPIQGTLTFTPGWVEAIRQPDGTCVLGTPTPPEIVLFAGTWDLATGTGTVIASSSDGEHSPVTFTANVTAPPPVFPMVVQSRIDPQTATASAAIMFRSEDVGTSGSVFVFAYAPAAVVKGTAKADGGCTFAQMSSSGQLVAISTSQLQAFFSGTLSAQGASVSILNNASTPAVAGATFYVGYGSSAASMIDEGVFRNAVTVPGSGVCPLLPSQTALWWNPAENGWGLNLNHQGNILFGTLFTYDASGAPLWLVMSGGAMQPDGLTFVGDLLRTTGSAFNAVPFTPIGDSNLTKVGTMSVAFSEANIATLTYTVNGIEVRKPIQRQVYGTRAANCMPSTAARTASANYQDLWWNPAEAGWGINITHQDNTLFATLFTYDTSGRDLWLVMSDGARQPDGSFFGDLYRTKGPAFNARPFTPIGGGDVSWVGTMRLAFSDGENGTLTYTYNDAPVTKSIVRQVFSSPVSACN